MFAFTFILPIPRAPAVPNIWFETIMSRWSPMMFPCLVSQSGNVWSVYFPVLMRLSCEGLAVRWERAWGLQMQVLRISYLTLGFP